MSCPDCGPLAVSHATERWKIRSDSVMKYATKPMELLWNGIRPAVEALRPERAAPFLFRTCATLGLGRIAERADEKNTYRARVLWEEAERRGIQMREFRPFNLPREIFFASYGSDAYCFDGLPRPRNARGASLDWMDDKGVILKKFGANGIPVPRGESCANIARAERAFRRVGGTVIVKPSIGSRSRHTYLHVTNIAELRRAFFKAKEIAPNVMVEEEIPGFVFRITLVGGKVTGVMRREPPHVMGDGTHAIRELIVKENENPLRHGPIFHELVMDEEAARMLAAQNLSPASVPARGRMVILHPKVSRTFGASTTEIPDKEVHPDNTALFLKMARVLDDPLVGIDFIIEDASRSWRDQKCGVIECNSLPFIDLHHFPLKGEPKNVAGAVWDLIWPVKP